MYREYSRKEYIKRLIQYVEAEEGRKFGRGSRDSKFLNCYLYESWRLVHGCRDYNIVQSTLSMQSIVQGLGTCPPEYFLKNRYYEIETGGNFTKYCQLKSFRYNICTMNPSTIELLVLKPCQYLIT